MNRIQTLFNNKKDNILNVYFTAGFPETGDTNTILSVLQTGGADLVEIGMPFSDPVADGETIQQSNQQALDKGMTLKLLFSQLENMRHTITLPVLLMGYINPVLQFGIENFCKKCQEVGVDGVILPDLPMQEYVETYKPVFEKYNLLNIFLITPQTSESRIREIDNLSKGFIYMVSSASTTGSKSGITDEQVAYFQRIKAMNLNNPTLIGFGISNHETYQKACSYANGVIIGSAFIKLLQKSTDLTSDVPTFISEIRTGKTKEMV
jgi:tryptophan synthase alpha chain